jgi:hypothetical protein
MGPGVATFLCGAESFPTPIRGHFLGLAAAVGKVWTDERTAQKPMLIILNHLGWRGDWHSGTGAFIPVPCNVADIALGLHTNSGLLRRGVPRSSGCFPHWSSICRYRRDYCSTYALGKGPRRCNMMHGTSGCSLSYCTRYADPSLFFFSGHLSLTERGT